MLLFGAWLCLRHKNLDLLTCQWSANPDEEDGSTFHYWMRVELMSKVVVRKMKASKASHLLFLDCDIQLTNIATHRRGC